MIAPNCYIKRGRIGLLVMLGGCSFAYIMTYYATTSIPFGHISHPACCLIYSLQPLSWYLGWRCSNRSNHWLRIALMVIVAVAAEFACARIATPVWIVTNPPLFLADTPIAQWVDWLSSFGLSAFLYLALFSMIPRMELNGWRRWQGALGGCAILFLLWCGGDLIASRVSVKKIDFSVALVQPNLRYQEGENWQPWQELVQLTDDFLAMGNRVELVIWPENAVTSTLRSRLNDQVPPAISLKDSANSVSSSENKMLQFDVAAMIDRYSSETDASLLMGSLLVDRVDVVKYGLTVPQSRRMNCACLWNSGLSGGKCDGCVQVHEKQALMPLREYTPSWLDFDFVRKWIMPGLKSNELTPGQEFRTVSFTDRKGIERHLGIAICFESWLPWLPQYHTEEPIDAIVHLVYDGDFSNYPVYTQRMMGAIQLRAIETRTWQLVCSTWAGTSVIDPRGSIVGQLPPKPGVLRTDEL